MWQKHLKPQAATSVHKQTGNTGGNVQEMREKADVLQKNAVQTWGSGGADPLIEENLILMDQENHNTNY